MNIHVLDPSRYSELPIEANPSISIVVVAEDNTGTIKGYWIAQLVVHTEPVWLHPDIRNGRVGIKMYAAMLAALSQFGINNFYAFADRQEISDYLQRLGLTLTPFICYKGDVPSIPSDLTQSIQSIREEENKECRLSPSPSAPLEPVLSQPV